MRRERVKAIAVGIITVLTGYLGQAHGRFLYLERLTTDEVLAPPSSPDLTPPTSAISAPSPPPPSLAAPQASTPGTAAPPSALAGGIGASGGAARSLHVLFIDGLRADFVPRMPHLSRMASMGASRALIADFPSMTYAGATTLATGVTPLYSGVRLNDTQPWVPLDSLSQRADAAGIDVFIDGEELDDFVLLMRPTRDFTAGGWAEAGAGEGRRLSWLYFEAVDRAGHQHGAASEQYAEAVAQADARVGALLERLDPARDALVVVSDHGHLDAGGHGGDEPEVVTAAFVAFGRPFVKGGGRGGAAPMRDFAPTVAAALGIAAPSGAFGVPMVDALDPALALVGAEAAEKPPDYKGMERAAAQDAQDRARFVEGARGRLLIGALVCLLIGLLAAALHGGGVLRLRARDFLPGVVYSGLFGLGHWALGYPMTWSIPRGEAAFIIELSAVGVLATAAAVWIARADRRVEEAWATALLFGLPYALASAWAGIDMRQLPAPVESYAVIFLATLIFYDGIFFGLRAFSRPPAPLKEPSSDPGVQGV